MTTIPPPGDPVWASIRLRYEQDQEAVDAIADDVGLHRMGLSLLAKKLGWRLRGKPRVLPRKSSKGETTAATIKRVKDILQQRLSELEEQIRALGLEVDAITNERQMRSTNLLVRTLEKVMDLERKERLRKRKEIEVHKYFDDGQRQQLADKIGRLSGAWARQTPGCDTETQRGDGVEQPVALLGEAGAATAARG
jgi:DNA-binding transcriptional MerR regulator